MQGVFLEKELEDTVTSDRIEPEVTKTGVDHIHGVFDTDGSVVSGIWCSSHSKSILADAPNSPLGLNQAN